jgi:hypothetical protein
MGDAAILNTNSFSVNEPEDKKKITALFDAYNNSYSLSNGVPNEYGFPCKTPLINSEDLFEKRDCLVASTTFYANRIYTINPVLFDYMTPTQKEAQRRELLHAFYLLSAQYQLDKIEGRKQKLKARSNQIFKCAELLNVISNQKKDEKTLEAQHLNYLGLEHFDFEQTAFTKKLVEYKTAINNQRLSWVWCNALLNSLIPIMEELRKDDPEIFTHCPDMKKSLGDFSLFTGYLSWVLYYARFAVNLISVFKHTFAPSSEEKKISMSQRLFFQLEYRKFSLINDSIWGLANMACFLWLTGDAVVTAGLSMGWVGNMLTIGLLIMDLGVAIWDLLEERKRYKLEMARYTADIRTLQAKIDNDDPEKSILQEEMRTLLAAQAQAKMNGYYIATDKKYNLYYAAALLGAFSVMGGIPSTILALGGIGASLGVPVVGALLSFVFNTVWNAKKSWLKIQKMEEIGFLAETECAALRARLNGRPPTPAQEAKIKQLDSAAQYQKDLVSYEKKQLLRTTLVDILVPITVFASLMMAPSLPIAIGIILAAALVAFVVKKLLSHFDKDTIPEARLPEKPAHHALASFPEQTRFFSSRPRKLETGYTDEHAYKNEVDGIGYNMVAAA